MPRTEKSAIHTAASLKVVASQLEEMAVGLRAAALLLDIEPKVDRVEVNYQPSLEKAINGLTSWVNDAKKSCNSARLTMAQKPAANGRVRKTGHVSDRPEK